MYIHTRILKMYSSFYDHELLEYFKASHNPYHTAGTI